MADQPKREPFAPAAKWGVDQSKRHVDPRAAAIGNTVGNFLGRILVPVFYVVCLPVLALLLIGVFIRRGPKGVVRVIREMFHR